MKTNYVSEKVARRKRYERLKKTDKCYCCGGYKMPGTAFCRSCTNRLPSAYRVKLFTASALGWADAYDNARDYLEKGE